MKMDKDSEVGSKVENFEWDIQGYSEDYIWLQVKFENPNDIGALDSEDFIEVTFWGIEFFKSFQGIEVEFGTKLYWRIQRQLSEEDAESMETIGGMVKDASMAIACFMFLFLGMGARLLPTWMFINSL